MAIDESEAKPVGAALDALLASGGVDSYETKRNGTFVSLRGVTRQLVFTPEVNVLITQGFLFLIPKDRIADPFLWLEVAERLAWKANGRQALDDDTKLAIRGALGASLPVDQEFIRETVRESLNQPVFLGPLLKEPTRRKVVREELSLRARDLQDHSITQLGKMEGSEFEEWLFSERAKRQFYMGG